MTTQVPPIDEIARVSDLLREKFGVRSGTLKGALYKAKGHLPRRIYQQGMLLAEAEPMAQHPKLRLTLDQAALGAAAEQLCTHLEAIDLADRRKGWWLGMLGGMAFNILAFAAVLVAFLMWRGYI